MHRFSSVVLVDGRGWLLLQERDEHPVIDPERWGFVGGGVEDGEDYEAAAYRELAEETGVRLDNGLEIFGTFEVLHPHCFAETGELDEFQLWATRTALTDDDIVLGEGRQIVFVDPAQVARLELTASATVALGEFLRSGLYQELTA